jgi:hypothetical protein
MERAIFAEVSALVLKAGTLKTSCPAFMRTVGVEILPITQHRSDVNLRFRDSSADFLIRCGPYSHIIETPIPQAQRLLHCIPNVVVETKKYHCK